ncbi:MAG: DUF547 domain-containing protein [Planctomycetota bacterium]
MPRPLIAAPLLSAALLLIGCASGPSVPPEVALSTYDDGPYAAVLAEVIRDGNVDYRAFDYFQAFDSKPGVTSAAAFAGLDGQLEIYLDAVARFGPESTPELFPTEDDQLAYYLNAYNAIMIRLWLDNGARTASDNARVQWGWWFTVNQWAIDRRTMSLDFLEQRLIRPRFNEARIHGALVCGAVDCPPLLDEPYVGDRLNDQLDGIMRAWLNTPAENAIEIRDNGDIRLAAIFGWYRDDFRPTGGLDAMIETHLDDNDPRKAQVLQAFDDKKIKFQGYDWTINQAK